MREAVTENDKRLKANIAPFGLRMQPELKAQVEAAAARNGRSINAEIVHQLTENPELLRIIQVLTQAITDHERVEAGLRQKIAAYSVNLPELPDGLTKRINRAAIDHGRSASEEIVQALEVAFPPPPSLKELLNWLATFQGSTPVPSHESEYFSRLHLLRKIISDPESYDIEETDRGVTITPKQVLK